MEDKIKKLNELSEEMKRIYEEIFQDIGKELEILEILRNDIAYVDIVKDQKETLEITIRVKEEDRPKIKEWLDNDK